MTIRQQCREHVLSRKLPPDPQRVGQRSNQALLGTGGVNLYGRAVCFSSRRTFKGGGAWSSNDIVSFFMVPAVLLSVVLDLTLRWTGGTSLYDRVLCVPPRKKCSSYPVGKAKVAPYTGAIRFLMTPLKN